MFKVNVVRGILTGAYVSCKPAVSSADRKSGCVLYIRKIERTVGVIVLYFRLVD
jgi:hypothetical protein